MNKIVLDSATLSRLTELSALAEVHDESGRLMGYYSPLTACAETPHSNSRIPVTDDEIKQLLQQSPGRPLAEILAELEQRP